MGRGVGGDIGRRPRGGGGGGGCGRRVGWWSWEGGGAGAGGPVGAPGSPGWLGLPGFAPVVVAVVVEEPIEPILHPATEATGRDPSGPQPPIALGRQTAAAPIKGPARPSARTGAGNTIHQLPAAAHPAFQPLIQGFGTPTKAAIIPTCHRCTTPILGAALLREPAPIGLIHGPRLPPAGGQPPLPTESDHGDGEAAPFEGPQKGGQSRRRNRGRP